MLWLRLSGNVEERNERSNYKEDKGNRRRMKRIRAGWGTGWARMGPVLGREQLNVNVNK